VWIVLCESNDLPALWAYSGLAKRGAAPLELITGDDLLYSPRWCHRIGTDGTTDIDIGLADGRTLRGSATKGVLNRLVTAPAPSFLAAPADRDYATQEFFALFMSWLHCLPGAVLNRPTPQGLSGRWRDQSEWTVLAAKAGLDTLSYQMASLEDASDSAFHGSSLGAGEVQNVIVAEDHVIGAPSVPGVVEGCRGLAELSHTSLLGIDLLHGRDGSWLFLAATPHPDLRIGGAALLDALASAMGHREEKH
jgi:hypothetical protein